MELWKLILRFILFLVTIPITLFAVYTYEPWMKLYPKHKVAFYALAPVCGLCGYLSLLTSWALEKWD